MLSVDNFLYRMWRDVLEEKIIYIYIYIYKRRGKPRQNKRKESEKQLSSRLHYTFILESVYMYLYIYSLSSIYTYMYICKGKCVGVTFNRIFLLMCLFVVVFSLFFFSSVLKYSWKEKSFLIFKESMSKREKYI